MSRDAFNQHVIDLIESIEDCLAKRRILPCLTLLYSGIDVIASLETNGRANREGFLEWVEKYLLKCGSFSCSAMDLYSARCGVVHTFTPESDLTRSGRARQIAYAWGTAKQQSFDKASSIMEWKNCVSIHMRDLIDAFQTASANYLEEIKADPARLNRMEKAAGLWFDNLDAKKIEDFLIIHESHSP
jgi:hypothetical protein